MRFFLVGPLNFLCAVSAHGLVDSKILDFQLKNRGKPAMHFFLVGPLTSPLIFLWASSAYGPVDCKIQLFSWKKTKGHRPCGFVLVGPLAVFSAPPLHMGLWILRYRNFQ